MLYIFYVQVQKISFNIKENTTLTTHPTLTKQLKMKDMLTEVTRTAKYTEVYSEFKNYANLMSNTECSCHHTNQRLVIKCLTIIQIE